MIIEWLDTEMNRARITRRDWPRFWRKVTAVVYTNSKDTHNVPWYFEGRTADLRVDGCYAGFNYAHTGLAHVIETNRRDARERGAAIAERERLRGLAEIRAKDNPWQPVQKPARLPRAYIKDGVEHMT